MRSKCVYSVSPDQIVADNYKKIVSMIRRDERRGLSGSLICTMSPEYDFHGFEQNPKVHQQRLLSYVVRIHDDSPAIIGVVAAGDLPKPGNSWLGSHVGGQVAPIAEHLVLHDGPRADEAHLATEHIPDLRQLIETGLAQKSPQTRDARIRPQLMVA